MPESIIRNFFNKEIIIILKPENDIGMYRDVLFFVGQALGGFFCINGRGRLELRKYGAEPVLEVQGRHRFSSSFSDFITRYTPVSSTNLRTQTAEYYIPENIVHGIDMNRELVVSSHPAVLDGFIDMFRR